MCRRISETVQDGTKVTINDIKVGSRTRLVPGTVSEGLNGWSEALTAGLAVWTAKTAKTSVTGSNFET